MIGETFRTYDVDQHLLRKLGLKTFVGKIWEKIYLGEVKNEENETSVKVWVQGAPAQFWVFEFSNEDKITKISTGSGTLSEYWPSIELMLENMFVINDTVKEHCEKCIFITG